jgi:hypothetical protein
MRLTEQGHSAIVEAVHRFDPDALRETGVKLQYD